MVHVLERKHGEQQRDESKVSSVSDSTTPEYKKTSLCVFRTRHIRGFVVVDARIQHPCEGMENCV